MIALRCVALRCVALRCVALRCVALRCVALRCVALRCVALRCVALRCVALRCVALRCVALRCVALRCVALHCIICFLRTGSLSWINDRFTRHFILQNQKSWNGYWKLLNLLLSLLHFVEFSTAIITINASLCEHMFRSLDGATIAISSPR